MKEIYKIPIIEVARCLGIDIMQGNRGRCFNLSCHKNGDRKPSLIFGTKANVWCCPVCNFNYKYPTRSGYGSNIDLVMLYMNIDFKEAVRWFNDYFHTGIEKHSTFKYKKRSDSAEAFIKQKKQIETNYSLNEMVYDMFLKLLGGISADSRNYLRGRGISNFMINAMQINDIKNYQKTGAELKNLFSVEELQKVGLFNEKGNFRFLKHRLIFPFFYDYSVRYIQGRNIDDNSEPKYLNSGTDISLPYNSNIIINNPDIEGETIYITEGVIDCISLIELGYNAVGVVGTNGFKSDWVQWFKEVEVVLAFDNDKAGKGAIKRITDMFAAEYIQVKSISPEDLPGREGCKDWNDILKQLRNNN